jgi:hypothetical protein
VQDKAYELAQEQHTLAEPCPKCEFHFPVMSPTASSMAVFKDAAPAEQPSGRHAVS